MRTRTIGLAGAVLVVAAAFATKLAGVVVAPPQVVAFERVELHARRGVFLVDGTPFTGVAVREVPGGGLAEEASFYEGKRDGARRQYYPNGQLSQESLYVHGRLEGLSRTWFATGVQRSEAMWVDGVTHGVQRQWYASGELFKEMHLVDGREEGMQRAWRENGAVYNNYEARGGRIYGLRRSKLCFDLDEEEVVGDP